MVQIAAKYLQNLLLAASHACITDAQRRFSAG